MAHFRRAEYLLADIDAEFGNVGCAVNCSIAKGLTTDRHFESRARNLHQECQQAQQINHERTKFHSWVISELALLHIVQLALKIEALKFRKQNWKSGWGNHSEMTLASQAACV